MALRTPLVNTGVFAITQENKHPEATMRWIDYFYSDEGAIFMHYGIEGEDFKYIDDQQGIERLTPEGMERDEFISKLNPIGVTLPRTHDAVQKLMLHKQDETDPQEDRKSTRLNSSHVAIS